MNKELLYSLKSPFRDDFQIHGFRFGSAKKTVAVVGAMRGDEIQQQFVCSQLVNALMEIEDVGGISDDFGILVVPSANHFAMNIGKRFWAMDNTDINRMFPGYNKGETTQRIAAALFEHLQGYEYGIQLASFYMSGDFIPHIRVMDTGYQDIEGAKLFGMPYVAIRKPKPYDTTLLNYNWQIWETKAYSLYAGQTSTIDMHSARESVWAILRFLSRIGAIDYKTHSGFMSEVLHEEELLVVKARKSGIFYRIRKPDDMVRKNEVIAKILDPYDGTVRSEVLAPEKGTIFFMHNKPLVHENTLTVRMIKG
ncbi:MAG: M14 family metallopeptidase [Desulfovibrionaceae bacterium]|nr:M14 family metallopeptidase [Desulfovibrionaceae bacterium]